jgi:hypothetical protein
MEILSKTDPFSQHAFNNMMDKSKMSDADYAKFLNDWDELKDKLTLEGMCGWDYFKYYNARDTQIMIKPILFLIDVWKKFNINMLNFMTLASCTQAIKYMMLYEDMRMDECYVVDDERVLNFVLTEDWIREKSISYKVQNEKAGCSTNNNIEFNFNNFYELNKLLKRQQFKCLLCNMRFTNSNKPTLDRIDNDIGHTLQNVRFACLPCNRLKSNKDEDTRVRI